MSSHTINQWLEEHGLQLCAFRWGDLPKSVAELTRQSLAGATQVQPTRDSHLLLLANAGPQFWRCLQSSSCKDNDDPVDTFSLELATEFQHTFLPASQFTQLYPTPKGQPHIPLMRLGGLAGWNIPSPLGLGLHPEYGPWFAYRVAFLTNSKQLPNAFYKNPKAFKTTNISTLRQSATLCASCSAPCVTSCPAQAVTYGDTFHTERCYEHRLPESSKCHTHCFARTACPVGVEHQYDGEQLAHHMSMSWR